MASLETVEIHHWNDPKQKVIINKLDFDPGKHTPWGEHKAAAKAAEKDSAPAGHSRKSSKDDDK
jgi:hypothetical protein